MVIVYPVKYLNYRPANGFKRTIAYLIDTLPSQMMLYVVSMSMFDVSPIVEATARPEVQMASLQARLLIGFGTIGIWIVYCILGELSPWRGTFGKKTMGISVRSMSGQPLSVRQVLVRNLSKILSAIPCYLGFFWAYFTHGNRAWHDSLSKTAVTERR